MAKRNRKKETSQANQSSFVAVLTLSRSPSAVTVSVGARAREEPEMFAKTGLSTVPYTTWAPYGRKINHLKFETIIYNIRTHPDVR